ncbi:MAG: T9SS type A sorting domain-containing protein [Crocinitomix sp.]|nr:T9SS type A sorting domain-containing protein [Crocinitomix sp.]
MLSHYRTIFLPFAFLFGIAFTFQSTAYSQIDHWETVVYETDLWSYMVPDAPVDADWNTLSFDAGPWPTASGGFGYGDGDDNTGVPSGTISVYQRIEFDIVDTSEISAAALMLDYDDGFVAYLNGVEISRALLDGAGQPDFDQLASGLHEAQIYDGEYPAQFTLSKLFLSANLNMGANVLCVQTHNESITSSDLSSRPYLFLGINSASSDYDPAPDWFVPPVILETSNLPIVIINTTDGASIVDDPKVSALMGIINNESGLNNVADPFNEFYGLIGIERRGSSSGTFPKKAYGLETRAPDSSNYNVSIFDWPIDNDWILYAPYSDKSLIRNVLTYKLGNQMGEYAPRTEMVEVVLNGDYIGVYVFMERIKENPGRVNIDPMEPTDITGNDLTGGYIVKVDKTTGGGIVAWTSPFAQAAPAWGNIRYQMHDPEIDEMHPDQLDYIEEYITDFETALDGPDFDDPVDGYRPYVNVRSFIDFMIVNEIGKNVDGYRISTFLHKERESEGGKLNAGPLWDFNLAWGNANYCQGGETYGWEIYFNDVCGGGGDLNNPFWWNRLVEDESYTHELNCRWQELRMTTLHTDTILAFVTEMETYLADAAERNFQRWPILGNYVWPNNFVGDTYAEEMGYLRDWTTERLAWMDDNMFGSCEDLSIANNDLQIVKVYPNPTAGESEIIFGETIENGQLIIKSATGQTLSTIALSQVNSYQLDLSIFEPALYIIQIYNNETLISNLKIIRQ